MNLSPSPDAESSANRAWWGEVLLILLLCYLKAGWPPPDVNEAHYLAKARHYWDPAWCPGDFFLNSADAHQVFYWTFGWVCTLVAFPVAAWIGRFVSWLLIAWAWQRLSWAMLPLRWAAVLSAGVMIVLTTITHMAGEWVIGGIEAKSFAFALVFWGLERIVRGKWASAFPILGLAAAFHVLVGGWAVVAALFAWSVAGPDKPRFKTLLPSLALGFAFSLWGLVPVLLLNRGVPSEVIRQAELIYVFERLPHHLVFNQFNHGYMARHAVAILAFGLLAAWLWRTGANARLRRLTGFVSGAVLLAVAGVVIDQATLYYDELAARLLRFYWFRLSDVFVPAGIALLVPLALERLSLLCPSYARVATGGVVLATVLPLLSWNYERQQHPFPGAVLQSWQPLGDANTWEDLQVWYADWLAMCDWIRDETPSDAIFLTPQAQQTFKWDAQRAEVLSIKDIPQDARGVVQWRQRRSEIYSPPVNLYGLAALSDAEIVRLANKYGASYVILEVGRYPRLPNLPRVYPPPGSWNETFSVYRIPAEGLHE
jgi:hypothetical protein